MSVGVFLKNSGWTALAAALVVSALPLEAAAQDRNRRGERVEQQSNERVRQGGERPPLFSEQVARIAQERNSQAEPQQRAQQVDRRSEQRAAQVEQRGDARAQQAARQGDGQRARQIDRRSEQAARQVEQRGDQRAERIERRGDQRAAQGQRNTTYAAQDRNRSYRSDDGNRQARDNDRRGNDNRWRDNDRRDNRWSNNDRRGDNRQWDRRWRDNSRYSWQTYRNSNRSVFRLGSYYSPYRNYSYRRLGIGGLLDSLFYSQTYWINDPWQYRLPEAYGSYRWVRYYDDALLVDLYSGEVVDVIYDVFW